MAKKKVLEQDDLQEIKGVEIFSAGNWNGDDFTTADLDELVHAFNSDPYRPAVKLGHNKKQKLAEEDGMPRLGTIGNLYRRGETLLADLVNIPKKLYQLLENKAYPNVSVEMWFDIKRGTKTFKRMLSAVALLGDKLPAVAGLKDVMALYSEDVETDAERKCYAVETEGLRIEKYQVQSKEDDQMSEVDKEQLAKLKEFEARAEASDAALKKLQDENTAAAAKVKEFEEKTKKLEIEAQVDKLVGEKVITPAMKPFVEAILGEEKKVYKFTIDKKDKELSKFEMLKECLKLYGVKDAVNAEGEKTVEGEQIVQSKDAEAAIKEYQAKNPKASYSDAYKAVNKGKDGEKF